MNKLTLKDAIQNLLSLNHITILLKLWKNERRKWFERRKEKRTKAIEIYQNAQMLFNNFRKFVLLSAFANRL